MSHYYGEVIKDGNVVGHFEYAGATDVPISHIWGTREEVEQNWRKKVSWNECKCGKPNIDVLLWVDGGIDGEHYPAKACLECKAIIDETGPYNLERPLSEDWPWPKKGHPLRIIADVKAQPSS